MSSLKKAVWMGMTLLVLGGCTHGMEDQPKEKTFAPSDFFSDGRSARPEVPDTVPRNVPLLDDFTATGRINGKEANLFPSPATPAMLERGRERYDIFCAVCHDRTGSGNGMVVQRGFPRPPSFHTDRLRNAPAGHFFNVITNGYGRMYSFNDKIPVEDRWAIVAYIRALQLSQHAALADVPPAERAVLERGAR